MTEIDKPTGGAQGYFEAIEGLFIRLRGSPLLLSPRDWQVANEWFEAGIPLELVCHTLETVFARRSERGSRGRIQSLRYVSEAVWKAWNEALELEGGGARQSAAAMDVQARLEALAASLPEALPNRDEWEERIRNLTGTSDEVEGALTELDTRLLAAAEMSLVASERERLGARMDEALANLRDRLPEDEIELARFRVQRRLLRDQARLPLLSLFSPEALSVDRDGPS